MTRPSLIPPLIPPVRWAAITCIGRQRSNNEDAVVVDDTVLTGDMVEPLAGIHPGGTQLLLAVAVADGMGGHAAGERASRIVADGLAQRAAGLTGGADGEQAPVRCRVGRRHGRAHAGSVAGMRDRRLVRFHGRDRAEVTPSVNRRRPRTSARRSPVCSLVCRHVLDPLSDKGSGPASTCFDIFEGTEQIQQLVIGRAISGLRIE